MQYKASSPSDPPDFKARIRQRQVELSYAALPLALFGIMLIATIILITQWPVIGSEILIAWFLTILILSLFRYYRYHVYQARKHKEGSLKIWEQSAIVGTIVSGIAWGSAAFLLLPVDYLAHQSVIIAAMVGMTAGGVVMHAALLPASLSYLYLVIVPLLVRLFSFGGAADIGLGMMVCVYLIAMSLGAIRIHRNLTESLSMSIRQQHSRQIIDHLAFHDLLTDLPNRRLLIERLSKDIARSVHHSHIGALIFLDLDNFKTLNDSMGHQQGDELLKQLALRLNNCLNEEDSATRLGGDEFVLLMPEVADQETEAIKLAKGKAEIIQEALTPPFELADTEIQMSASIGIALFPIHADNPIDLLKRADYAMYQAKAGGRNNISFYSPDMQEKANLLMSLEQGLRNALRNNDLVLHYQPLVSINGEIIGAEALVRWHHPQDGLIAPDNFIEHAEQSGLIIQLGKQVLEQVCQHFNILVDSGLIKDDFKLSINVSPVQFSDPNFVDDTLSTIKKYAIQPRRMTLEVTEHALLLDLGETVKKLKLLKQAGFTLAIDDFGTGHSSLAYIKKLPIDIIKIDRILVKDITREKTDAIIVEGTIAIARKLGVKTVAEGVEEQPTFDRLKSYECDIVQGELIASAMDLQEFKHFLAQIQRQ